jgi:hypothetical protein
VKIIKQGSKPEDKVYTDECSHCSTVFEYERKEASGVIYDYRDGDYITIDCPVCGTSLTRNVMEQKAKTW